MKFINSKVELLYNEVEHANKFYNDKFIHYKLSLFIYDKYDAYTVNIFDSESELNKFLTDNKEQLINYRVYLTVVATIKDNSNYVIKDTLTKISLQF